jgi:hypothetical protein
MKPKSIEYNNKITYSGRFATISGYNYLILSASVSRALSDVLSCLLTTKKQDDF